VLIHVYCRTYWTYCRRFVHSILKFCWSANGAEVFTQPCCVATVDIGRLLAGLLSLSSLAFRQLKSSKERNVVPVVELEPRRKKFSWISVLFPFWWESWTWQLVVSVWLGWWRSCYGNGQGRMVADVELLPTSSMRSSTVFFQTLSTRIKKVLYLSLDCGDNYLDVFRMKVKRPSFSEEEFTTNSTTFCD
jgi:hypothetical protein